MLIIVFFKTCKILRNSWMIAILYDVERKKKSGLNHRPYLRHSPKSPFKNPTDLRMMELEALKCKCPVFVLQRNGIPIQHLLPRVQMWIRYPDTYVSDVKSHLEIPQIQIKYNAKYYLMACKKNIIKNIKIKLLDYFCPPASLSLSPYVLL